MIRLTRQPYARAPALAKVQYCDRGSDAPGSQSCARYVAGRDRTFTGLTATTHSAAYAEDAEEE